MAYSFQLIPTGLSVTRVTDSPIKHPLFYTDHATWWARPGHRLWNPMTKIYNIFDMPSMDVESKMYLSHVIPWNICFNNKIGTIIKEIYTMLHLVHLQYQPRKSSPCFHDFFFWSFSISFLYILA